MPAHQQTLYHFAAGSTSSLRSLVSRTFTPLLLRVCSEVHKQDIHSLLPGRICYTVTAYPPATIPFYHTTNDQRSKEVRSATPATSTGLACRRASHNFTNNANLGVRVTPNPPLGGHPPNPTFPMRTCLGYASPPARPHCKTKTFIVKSKIHKQTLHRCSTFTHSVQICGDHGLRTAAPRPSQTQPHPP